MSYTDKTTKNLFYSKINDVLIPCSGETALDISTSTCVLQDNIIIGGDLNVLRPKLQNGKYLSYLLSNKKRVVIAKYAQGDSIVHLYGEKIKNINIDLPTIEEQEKVSKLLEILNKKIKLQKKKIEALKIYKKGLIQKYFESKNGEKIKISEILEEVINKTTENNQYDVISSTKDGLFLQSEYFNRSIASDNNIGYKILKKNQIVLSPQNLWMGNINYNNKYEIGMVSPSYKIFNINKNQLSYGRGYVYFLQYHLVWCTKYRKKVLKDGIDLECKKMLQDLAEEYRFQILAMEVMPDHIHMLVDCRPQFYISDMIKIMKGNLARQMFLLHPELKKELWGGHLWNPSYCAVTVSDRSREQVSAYIEGQKEKEKRKP